MSKLRSMADENLAGLGNKVAEAFIDWVQDEGLTRIINCCGSCTHVIKKGPIFCDKYKMVPPVAIIVGDKKCEGYNDEWEIPF